MDKDLIELNKQLNPLLEEARSITDETVKKESIEKICNIISNYPAASDLQTIEEYGRTKFWWKMNNQPYGFIL